MSAMKNKIFINQSGYYADGYKTAVCALSSKTFTICSENGSEIRSGELSAPISDPLSGDTVKTADFSDLRTCGRYYIKAGTKRSAIFEIKSGPYTELKKKLLKSFYFNRCGIDLLTDFAGPYARRKCHSAPIPLYENETIKLDVSGGWHDSGSFGKHVITACTALAHLLNAYIAFPASFSDRTDIPDSKKNIPDILTECRWELEWLLKMQDRDGGVYHKISSAKITDCFVMPDEDTSKMFIFGKSHSACASFAACTALASRVYRPFDEKFADRLRSASFSAWVWLMNNPDHKPFSNPPAVTDGEYAADNFNDQLFWAACELYAVTGDEEFHKKIHDTYAEIKLAGFDWIYTAGFGSLTYIFSDCPKDELLLGTMKSRFRSIGDYFSSMAESNGFGIAKENNCFLWGSNMTVLTYAMTLAYGYIIHGNEKYLKTAVSHFDYILGKNPLGMCYVTGISKNSCMHPHHFQSAADDVDDPVPGLVCGGPDMLRSDDYAKWHIPMGTPPAKCYVDNEFSYSTNDTTIYWDSPAVFMAAFFEELERDPKLTEIRKKLI